MAQQRLVEEQLHGGGWTLRSVLFVVGSLFCMEAPAISARAGEVVPPVVPDGFTIEKAVSPPLVQRPIFAAFDSDGFLFVGESNGENLKRDDMLAKKPHWITRLEDTDGDGVFDKSVKFVENITLPQGMLCYRGSVYAACPPSIWKFTDTDGDGKADQREEILTGFGFNGNACDTHGPFLSPTGRLYIAQGRHGHEFKDKDGRTYSKGKAARIYSCRLDGSDVRVHCGGGFDNPVEIDFTEEGEAIGTVNILYRDRGDCLMHWVEGGVYPREDQADCVAEFKWTGGLLGPIHNLGHVAVSGLMRYRGVHFGPEFHDRWFFTEFNTHKVRYAELKPSGSTFTADVHEFLTSASPDFHPTDVLEDADGSLLVVDTGAWFLNGCPTSRVSKPQDLGAIWRIRKTGGTKLDDPRGKTRELTKQKPVDWVKLLDDPRPAVREAAFELLAQRPSVETFFAMLSAGTANLSLQTSRRLVQLTLVQQQPYWVNIDVNAREASLRRAAALAAGDYESLPPPPVASERSTPEDRNNLFENAVTLLISAQSKALESDATVQFAAAQSLSQLIPRMDIALRKKCTPRISDFLLIGITRPDADRFLEHQITVALTRLAFPEPMVNAIRVGSPIQRRAALIALDQMDDSPLTREMVVPLLGTDDPALLAAVLEVISRHDGWGAETLSLFSQWLKDGELSAERMAAMRSFLAAQVRDAKVQKFIADAFGGPAGVPNLRRMLVEIMQHAAVDPWPVVWNESLALAFDDTDAEVRQRAFETVLARGLNAFDEALHKIAGDRSRSADDRMSAVAAFAPREKDTSRVDVAELQSLAANGSASSLTRLNAAKAIASLPLDSEQLIGLTDQFGKLGPMELRLLLPAFARSAEEPVGLALVKQLEVRAEALSVAPDELASVLRRYPASVQQAGAVLLKKLGVDPDAQRVKLEELAPLLDGGDVNAGRAVFLGRKANCAACHHVEGLPSVERRDYGSAASPTAGRIGPDLSKIAASRSPRDLLEAVVFPSASFVNGYRPYIVVTDSGKSFTGVISSETTETITLKQADLTEVRVARRQIDEMKEGTVSIMPKGLDTQLTADELRNLLAFLRSRK
jgi:putative membrane-bound dehydrogenase-like protein